MRRRPMLAVGLATALVATACSAGSSPETPPDDGTPPALEEFYEQEIVFEPCEPYATNAVDEAAFANDRFDCARVEVPLDYADPDGPRGEVALLRAAARGEKIGSLLVNPGGPGGSGMGLVAGLGPFWDALEVGERFDVIGFDPRGVGASTPRVQCFTDAEADANAQPGPYAFPIADQEAADDLAQRCIDGTGGVAELASVGSVAMVQDMDVMREVLGDEGLSYLGYSYGSELGAMYADMFGDNVRALVIDGAVHPGLTEPEFRQGQFSAFQGAFENMAALCATDPDCVLGPDPEVASEVFQDFVLPLDEEPLPTSLGRDLTGQDVVHTVTTLLLGPGSWPDVLAALSDLADGDGDAMLTLRDNTFGRGPDGRYGAGLNVDANLAIRCMDNPRTQQEQDALLAHARVAAPFMGIAVEQSVYECAGWPEPVSRELPWLSGGLELPPTLVVSVTGDPGTPHEGGIAMAEALGSSLLTVEGNQHGVALYGGNECVDTIVTDYLVDLSTPPDDARCTP